MSTALYVVLEDDDQGFDTFVNGKSLPDASDELDRLASRLGVKPLMSFFSQNVDELTGFADAEGIDLSDVKIGAEKWFDADDGLKTVRALLEYVEANPNDVADADSISQDLREFESVLRQAAERGLRWHLAVDF